MQNLEQRKWRRVLALRGTSFATLVALTILREAITVAIVFTRITTREHNNSIKSTQTLSNVGGKFIFIVTSIKHTGP